MDILAENEKGEFIIFEIQNTREHTYFHRMLYGVSKVITDNISLGDDYDKVRKVYSINIVYFTLGQAKDYVYHGKTMFQGLHQPNDILKSPTDRVNSSSVMKSLRGARLIAKPETYSRSIICSA